MPVIAKLVQTSPDRVREVIHNFNEMGLTCLDPKWAGGRPRRISPEDKQFIAQTAKTRPEKLGQPFTHWSIRKLRSYLADNPVRKVMIGRERLRQILEQTGITFQLTKTWKESNDPEQTLWRRSAHAARPGPDGQMIYVILDKLSAHKSKKIRDWCARNHVELCFTPTYSSWANRSRDTSGRCGPLFSTTRTTPITRSSPAGSTLTCAGVTKTPKTPRCLRWSASVVPRSEPKGANAGAGPLLGRLKNPPVPD